MSIIEDHDEELSFIGKEVFLNLFDAHIIIDEKNRIRHANNAACIVTGYKVKEIIGLLISDLIPDANKCRHEDHVNKFMKNPTHRPMGLGLIVKLKRKSGVDVQVEVALAPMKRSHHYERRIIVRIIPKETLIA